VISTHILEGKVFEMIRETMLDPAKLRGCVKSGAGLDDRSAARDLARLASKISGIEQDRRALIDRYAVDHMTGDEYIAANRALDEQLEGLVRAKARLAAAARSAHDEDFVDASVRQFCATAKARLEACSDFDKNRQFVVDHVERVTYNRYSVTLAGSVAVQTSTGATKLRFQIEGKIDIAAIRSNSCRKAALAAMTAPVFEMATAENQAVSLPLTRYAEVAA
jgi:hypothetical protein